MSRTCPACSTAYDDDVLHCPEDGRKTVEDEPEPDPDDELIGRSIGSYVVTRLLGEGGMGSVYMAEHPVIGSRVAIKFLHPRFSGDRKIVDRFFNEARAVNLIGHDNILKILDLNVTEDDRHYFVMEFLRGRPLQDLMTPDVPLPLEVTGPILLQFCEALQAAHDKRIYHRDIKPDNIYLIVHKGRKNFVKVVDFGIAKLTDKSSGRSTGQTQTGMVMGTPAYMSPEQAGGMGERIGPTSDVYSTGVMMYQLATGRLPFPGTTFGEVLIGHLQLEPPPPRELNPRLPEAYEKVILRALRKPQAERQQSMRELQTEIKEAMDALGISPELPRAEQSDLPTLPPTPRTHPPARTPKGATPQPRAAGQLGHKPAPQQGPTQLEDAPELSRTRGLTHQLAPAQRSRLQLYLGLAVLAFALLGAFVGAAVWSSAQEAERRSKSQTDSALERARKAAREELEKERLRAEDDEAKKPVPLSVVSLPVGADVVATWDGGSSAGKTDFIVEVPRNATVTLQFRHEGYVPYTRDVIASRAQTVSAALVRIPVERVAAKPAPRRKPQATAQNPEDALPIGDEVFNEK